MWNFKLSKATNGTSSPLESCLILSNFVWKRKVLCLLGFYGKWNGNEINKYLWFQKKNSTKLYWTLLITIEYLVWHVFIYSNVWKWMDVFASKLKQGSYIPIALYARTYLQLPLRQWCAGNVYLLVLSSWRVNIAENPIAVMGF